MLCVDNDDLDGGRQHLAGARRSLKNYRGKSSLASKRRATLIEDIDDLEEEIDDLADNG